MRFLKRGDEVQIPQQEPATQIKTKLLPHQERVINKLKNQRGLLIAHSMGRGKTITGLGSINELNKPTTVITPAALKGNILKEQSKHFAGKLPISLDSIENVARKQTSIANPMLLVDEAHKLRDPASKALQAIKKINKNKEKTVLMTGTPMVNGPSDISSLINLVSGEQLLPEQKAEFEKKYIFNKKVNPSFWQSLKGIKPGEIPVINKNEKDNLRNIFNKWVDYEAGSKEGFPTVNEEEINVPMTDKQLAVYDTLIENAPPWVAAKIKSNLPPNKQESKQLNAYLTAARQASNTTAPFTHKGNPESPKIQRAYEELKKTLDADPQAKAVVYSQYLDAGLNPYKELLTKNNIPFGEFSGKVKQQDREQMIKDYNEGKLRALLLSSAGGVGLDLKNTSLFQLMESAWNDPTLDQAKARAIRYKSHDSLPLEKRNVKVQRFLATRPETLSQRLGLSKKQYAVDEYLKNLSSQKSNLISQFEELMKPQEQPQQKIADITSRIKKLNTEDNQRKALSLGTTAIVDGNSKFLNYELFDYLQKNESKLSKDKFIDFYKKNGNKFKNDKEMESYFFNKRVNNLANKANSGGIDTRLGYADQFHPGTEKLVETLKKHTPKDFHEPLIERIKETHPLKPTIFGDSSSPQANILHEIGHFKNETNIHSKNPFTGRLVHLSALLQKKPINIAATAYSAIKDDPNNNLGLGYLAASSPLLMEEAGASLRAVNTMRKLHGWKKGLSKSKHLLPAFMSYALPAAMPLIATQINKAIRKPKEKTAAIKDDVEKFKNTQDYKLLMNKVKSPKFQNLVKETKDDPRFHNFIDNMGKHLSGLKKGKVFHIESQSRPGKTYEVVKHKDDSFTCSCPNYMYKGAPDNQECKHIAKVKNTGMYKIAISDELKKRVATERVARSFFNNEVRNKTLFKGNAIPLKGPKPKYSIKPVFMDDVIARLNQLRAGVNDSKYTLPAHIKRVKTLKTLKRIAPGAAIGAGAIGAGIAVKKYMDGRKTEKHAFLEKIAKANVPLHQQEKKTTCSAACLKMVLNKYGLEKSEKELEQLIEVGKSGAEGNQIRDAAKKLGFKAEWKQLSLKEAINLLEKDIPIIADCKSWNYPGKFHWVVLEDIDLKNNKVEIADPNTKGNKRSISLKELDERWKTKHMHTHKDLTRAGVVIYPTEKTAILGTMALAGGLHLGANMAMKALKGTQTGHNLESSQFSTGLRNRLNNQKLNPVVKNVATYGVGPEALMSHDAGTMLGDQLAPLSKGRQFREMKKIRKGLAMTDSLRQAPIVKDVIPGINRTLENRTSVFDKLPKVPINQQPTRLQKALSFGLGAGAVALEPHSAVHMGINATRNAVGNSQMGQKFMKDQLIQGVQNKAPGKLMSTAMDLAISPAALDTRRIGLSAYNELQNPRLGRILKMMGGGILNRLPSLI